MRLSNFHLRENFLTRIFISARFRALKAAPKMNDLVQFHAENKLLFMAYSQKEMRIMGPIVANHEKKKIDEVFVEYEEHFHKALATAPKYKSIINVLLHAFGYFSCVCSMVF